MNTNSFPADLTKEVGKFLSNKDITKLSQTSVNFRDDLKEDVHEREQIATYDKADGIVKEMIRREEHEEISHGINTVCITSPPVIKSRV